MKRILGVIVTTVLLTLACVYFFGQPIGKGIMKFGACIHAAGGGQVILDIQELDAVTRAMAKTAVGDELDRLYKGKR